MFEKRLKILQNYNAGIIYFMVLFFSIFILFLYFSLSTRDGNPSVLFKIFSALADSSLLIFPCLFIKGRWRILTLLIPVVLVIVLWANLIYYRNFGDLIPASSYFNSHLRDQTVVDSIASSIITRDLIIFIVVFLPIIYFSIAGYRKVAEARIRFKIIGIDLVMIAISWGITMWGGYRRVGIYTNMSHFTDVLEQLYPKHATNWKFFYDQHNFTGYLIRCMLKIRDTGKKLNSNETEYIKQYLSEKNIHRSHMDSTNNSSSRMNLIMIVVESLPSKILDLEERDYIVPYLSGLIKDSTVIVKKSFVLTGYGRSSDAQFIYNTGLLPLRDEPLVSNFAYKDYPSIAKALQYNSLEIIGERSELWSHKVTNKSYGFDRLISNIALTPYAQDSVIFKRASDEVRHMPQPFFLFISTISMHSPYTSSKVKPLLNPDMLQYFNDLRDVEYLQRLRHFDENLERFIEGLKKDNLFQNSIIIIMGDHVIGEADVSEKLYDECVPLLIINSLLKDVSGREISQIDVFPTLLDMFGLKYKYLDVNYTGLGESIFQKGPESVSFYPSEEDYEVSELIIKGQFD